MASTATYRSILPMVIGALLGDAGGAAGDPDADSAPAADAAAPFGPESLKGPYERLEDYCRQTAAPDRCIIEHDGQAYDEVDHRPPGPSAVRGRGLIRAARVFFSGDGCHLAIRTDAWWVREDVSACAFDLEMRRFRVTELALRNVTGGREPEVVLRMRTSYDRIMDGPSQFDELVACGIAVVDGVDEVQCLPNIVEVSREWGCQPSDRPGHCMTDAGRPSGAPASVAVAFDRRGLVISARRRPLEPNQRAYLGRHPLAWR
jgi:hypothetical protein